MRVFVTGATGFVGSAVIQELLRAGHKVRGLARSEAGAKAVSAAGAEAVRGTIEDLALLKQEASKAEGVIHTAHNHDFEKVSREVAGEQDLIAVKAMLGELAGKAFVNTTGLSAPDEDEAPAGFTRPSEQAAVHASGVRASVIRLPPSVHGDGDHGLVPMLIDIARAKGVSAYIGEGKNRWAAVHRFDAALLYRLALEKGVKGSRYHALAGDFVPTREIAEAIGRGLKLPVVSKPQEEAMAHFGFLGMFFGREVTGSSAKTRQRLGWNSSHKGLIRDIEGGTYFK
ncbi:MAG TPA: SDR family oxidoreductase [Myxococcales bacterium]|jgi:nucleoside-diphosphate-sugar epimerase|nr:SDR family oxidoreductase [Myxococcales bacterium]